ncbi:hypothetical protein [Nocardia sp. alder85J]|uniref:hypothetical protein n=1 Tax=Nocardia sp. alder85J TaxID=2862949 RepID=UPI001CD4CCC3|nr:hypothetical protein [Nocardia sp. alder85J]MCX4095716.1 hypothetical protein [Nocardia sp. alder85J]
MTSVSIELPSTGSFNHAALSSGRRFEPAAVLAADSTIHGLAPEAGYIWGTLRDDEGGLHSIMRRIPAVRDNVKAGDDIRSLGGKLILLSSTGVDEQLQLRREPRYAPDSNEMSRRVVDSTTVELSAPANEHGRAVALTLTTEGMAYRETDIIDVTGTLIAPPLQWFLPGPDSSLLYLTQTWLVQGDLGGKRVRGFLFWEEAWMRAGARLYVDKDPLHDAEYTTWYSWANHYEDGTAEVGHFLYGNGRLHVGVIGHSDGSVTSAHTMDAQIRRNADGYWHDGIDYTIDGEAWTCDPDPRGRMEGLGRIPNPQQEGRMHRVADTRVPDVWMAWGESVPGNGDRRRW